MLSSQTNKNKLTQRKGVSWNAKSKSTYNAERNIKQWCALFYWIII